MLPLRLQHCEYYASLEFFCSSVTIELNRFRIAWHDWFIYSIYNFFFFAIFFVMNTLCEKSPDLKIVKSLLPLLKHQIDIVPFTTCYFIPLSFFSLFHPDQIICTLMRQHYLPADYCSQSHRSCRWYLWLAV